MEKNELVKQKKSIDRKEVMENELTLIFAQLPKIWSDEKNAEVLYQFCRDINDWILGRYLREGNHFHVPFVNYTKDNTLYLDREKCQTIVDAKNLNYLYINKKKIPWEINELRIWYSDEAHALEKSFVTIKSAIDSMLNAWHQLDIEQQKKHKHIRFRESDLVWKINLDVDYATNDKASSRLYVIKRRDAMLSFYNMMWPQRMKMFDEWIDKNWPYITLNKQWKRYVYTTFMRLYSVYQKDNGYLKLYKVFPRNDYKSMIQHLTFEDIDESLIIEMIQYLFGTHIPTPNESSIVKSHRNDLRNRRWIFSDLFVWSMYLDNMVDQEEIGSFFDWYVPFLETRLLDSDLQEKYGIEFSLYSRKKDYISQLLKLMRSADALSMLDYVWAHIKYYPRPSKDTEWQLIKDLTSLIYDSFVDYCKYHQYWLVDANFSSKWELSMTDKEKDSFINDIDDSGLLRAKKKNNRVTHTWSNSDYLDAKVTSKTLSKTFDWEHIGAEVAMMPLINNNDVWLAAHHFLTKQKIVETFARDRSLFTISQYMEFFDASLKSQTALLRNKKKKIDWLENFEKKQDMYTQRLTDSMYPLSNGEKINLLQFRAITDKNRHIADKIALDQLKIEMNTSNPKIYRFLYKKDATTIREKSFLEKTRLHTRVWVPLSVPNIIRNPKGKVLDNHFFVSSNYKNALKNWHISSKSYIAFPQKEDEFDDLQNKYWLQKIPYLARNGKKEKMTKEERNHAVDVSGTSKAKNGELYQVLSD